MKPSEDILNRLQVLVDADPKLKEGISSPDEIVSGTVASVVMLQAILDWLDEKFPNQN